MGVTISNNTYSGTCSTFNEWRKLIAQLAKIDLNNYEGWGGEISLSSITNKGLYILFNHSDCEGELTPKECKLIAVDLIKLNYNKNLEAEFYKNITTKFIQGCLDAYENNITLEFH